MLFFKSLVCHSRRWVRYLDGIGFSYCAGCGYKEVSLSPRKSSFQVQRTRLF